MAFTFDESYYLTQYPDVAAAVSLGYFKSGYDHYVKYGAKELRNPNEFFNAQEYAAANPDVLSAVSSHNFASVWDHYVAYGLAEGRAPSKALTGFDGAAYLAANADVAAAIEAGSFHNALEHYLNFGAKEGRPLGTGTVQKYTLTNDTDVKTANVFDAPLVYTPGGNDRINSLQDEDKLTGTGVNPTLNVTLGNSNDNGGNVITPKLAGIETINVAFTGSVGATSQHNGRVDTLNLEDASGLKAINVTRIADGGTVTLDNLAEATSNFSLDSISVPATVNFLFQEGVLEGTADAATLALKGVNVTEVALRSKTTGLEGFESLTLKSEDAANTLAKLTAPQLANLTIVGDKALTLANLTTKAEEVDVTSPAIVNGANVLKTIDASALTGKLTIDLSNYTNKQTSPSNSGEVFYLDVKGGTADDTFIVTTATTDSGLKIAGGEGSDTLKLYASLTDDSKTAPKAAITSVENLKVIAKAAGTIEVDTNLISDLGAVNLRNESEGGPVTFDLDELSATAAKNIFAYHSTSGGNALAQNKIQAELADASGASDEVVLTLLTDLNTQTRYNVQLETTGKLPSPLPTGKTAADYVVENVTIDDKDNESNTVALLSVNKGTVTLKGGVAGQFLNLDHSENVLRKDLTGGGLDGSQNDLKGFANDVGTNTGALTAATIDGTAYAGDVIVRVSTSPTAVSAVGAQTVKLGAGNDTLIFDNLADSRAGLTISDTVSGGAGTDTLAIGGNVAVNLGASEWTHVSGFEKLQLLGNGATYSLTLTNQLIDDNAADGNRIEIINDNDTANDTAGAAVTAGVGVVSAVTIDARALSAENSFNYNGEEGLARTNDRFIFADVNINGNAVIDGGAVDNDALNNSGANLDVLEVRNAAVVSTGDLANVKNVGIIELTNDLSVSQTSTVQLNDNIVDAMVDSYQASNATTHVETLTVRALDNLNVNGATTRLVLEAADLTAKSALTVLAGRGVNTISTGAGADRIVLLGNYTAGTYGALVEEAGISINSQATAGAVARVATDTIAAGAGFDTLVTYGALNLVGANLTGFEAIEAHSALVITTSQWALILAARPAGTTTPLISFTGAGNHQLTIVDDTAGVDTIDLSLVSVSGAGATLTYDVNREVRTGGTTTNTYNNAPATSGGAAAVAAPVGTTPTNNQGLTATLVSSATSPYTLLSNTENIVKSGAGAVTVVVGTAGVTAPTGSFSGLTTGDTVKLTDANADLKGVNGGASLGASILDLTHAATAFQPTLTVAQHNALTTISVDHTGGNDSIILSNAGTVTGNANVFGYGLLATSGNDFTLGTAAQHVTFSGTAGADTLRIAGLTTSGVITNFDANDTLVATTGANISGSTFATAGTLNLTGTITVTAAQNNGFTTVVAAGTTDQVTLSDNTAATSHAAVEKYALASGGQLTLATGHTAVNIDGTAGNETVVIGGQTVTGTYALGAGTDVITATTGANIAGLNGGAATTAETLNLTGAITLTQVQLAGFGTITAAGGSDSITLTTAGAVTAAAAVETYTLANGANTFTFAANTAQTVNTGTGADVVNVTLADASSVQTTVALAADTVTDRIAITNTSQEANGGAHVTVTGFNVAHDAVTVAISTTGVTNAGYQALTAGTNTNVTVPVASVVEIESSNLASLTATADAGAVETAIMAAVGTIGTGAYTFVLYSGTDAGIYTVNVTNADIDDNTEFTVELVGVLSGVGANALTVANVY